MKPIASQSLDSLLGVVAPQPTQVGASGTPADAALFGDLLGLLMAAQPMNPELQMPGVMPSTDANPVTDPSTIVTNPKDANNSVSLPIMLQSQLNPELMSQFGLPQATDANAGLLLTAITESDSAMTLTLTPAADPNKPILLTISKDVFNNIVQQLQNGETPNADATNRAFSPAMLQALLTKLNAKEVTITNAPQQLPMPSFSPAPVHQGFVQKNIPTDEKSAAIQLLKEMSGTAATVSMVAAEEPLAPSLDILSASVTTKNNKPVLPQIGQMIGFKTAETALPVTPVAQNTDEFSTLVGNQTVGESENEVTTLIPEKAKGAVKCDQFGNLLTTSGTAQTSVNLKANTEVSARPILQLPENVQELLKPYGKTVTLKIEPEHLGTATLSLQMQQGALRARVVVESTEAKNLLESSLGQLVTQLSKSNIKVDSVEVYIGGQTVADQQSSRQQRQQKSFRNGRFTSDKKLAGVMSAPASAISRYAFGAVPGGLNLVV